MPDFYYKDDRRNYLVCPVIYKRTILPCWNDCPPGYNWTGLANTQKLSCWYDEETKTQWWSVKVLNPPTHLYFQVWFTGGGTPPFSEGDTFGVVFTRNVVLGEVYVATYWDRADSTVVYDFTHVVPYSGYTWDSFKCTELVINPVPFLSDPFGQDYSLDIPQNLTFVHPGGDFELEYIGWWFKLQGPIKGSLGIIPQMMFRRLISSMLRSLQRR
jgi:hypothetical protein